VVLRYHHNIKQYESFIYVLLSSNHSFCSISCDIQIKQKRDKLQTLCEEMLTEKFAEKNIILLDVLIRDVNLPTKIKDGIEAKEAQKQKNELAEKINAEKQFLATAAITEAEGIKQSAILKAEGEAEAIRVKQQQLRQSPQYIEYIKWQGFASTGNSPYGSNNVFGGNTSVIKGLK
jgi:regulator of protease activity HflC (stomatin/prohibitin superfamily)